MGRFLLSVSFAAGFVIRDLMEDKSPVREAARDAWKGMVDFLTPASDKTDRKRHFPDKREREDLDNSKKHVDSDDSDQDDSDDYEHIDSDNYED